MLFITSEEATTPAVSDLRILLPRVTGTEFFMLTKSVISFGEKSPSGPITIPVSYTHLTLPTTTPV